MRGTGWLFRRASGRVLKYGDQRGRRCRGDSASWIKNSSLAPSKSLVGEAKAWVRAAKILRPQPGRGQANSRLTAFLCFLLIAPAVPARAFTVWGDPNLLS